MVITRIHALIYTTYTYIRVCVGQHCTGTLGNTADLNTKGLSSDKIYNLQLSFV